MSVRRAKHPTPTWAVDAAGEPLEVGGCLRALRRPAAGGVDDRGATCSAWAETSYAEYGGRKRLDIVHLVLEHPRPLLEPVPCRGALGLWTVPSGVDDQVLAQLEAVPGA